MADDQEQFSAKDLKDLQAIRSHLHPDHPIAQKLDALFASQPGQPYLGGNPTAMANRALEMSSPGRGLQVSGREMNPRSAAFSQYPIRTSDSAPVAGAIRAVNENILPMIPPRNPKATISDTIHQMGTAAPELLQNIVSLPERTGTAIAGSVNAFRGENPAEGYAHAYEAAGDVGQMAPMMKLVPKVGPTVGEAATTVKPIVTAPIRGAAKVGNTALSYAPAAGKAVGLALGLKGLLTANPWEALAGPRYGAKIGEMLGNMKFPGENLGLPPEYKTLPSPNRPLTGTPLPPRPIPAFPERTPIQYSENAGKRTITPQNPVPLETPQETPLTQDANIPTPNEVAVGLGFKNATQAMGRLTPQVWNETYSKIVNGETSPTASVAKPPDYYTSEVSPVYPSTPEVNKWQTPASLAWETSPANPQNYMSDAELAAREMNQLGEVGRLQEQRELAARNSHDITKLAGLKPTESWAEKPLPDADMSANRLLGWTGRTPSRKARMRQPNE